MKQSKNYFTFFIATVVFLSLSLACKFSAGTSETNTSSTPANTSSTPTTNASSNSTSTAPTTTKNIAGNYEISGTNVDGQGGYKGYLTITERGEVYQFSWDVGGKSYDGVAVQTDNSVAVSYTEGTDGKGCGVVLYKINSDGSLDGKAGYWGNNNSENEKATRTKGTDLAGEYEVKGTNPDGKEYKNQLSITPSGPGFIFKWTGASSLEGVGIKQGNFVTAGFGGKQCAFVSYEVKSDGSLDGRWGGLGISTFGSEKALKK